MNDKMSQQEIDEMIRQVSKKQAASEGVLTPIEIDTLGEIGNISMGSAATALHEILNRKVLITTPSVRVCTLEQLGREHPLPYVVVDVHYTEGLAGNNLFILKMDDVKLIADIMMGGEGTLEEGDLSEFHISAISEAMNQMMGGVATAMADLFGRRINISPPRAMVIRLSDQKISDLLKPSQDELIQIGFQMEIEGLVSSSIMQLMPLDFGRQLASEILKKNEKEDEKSAAKNPMAESRLKTDQQPSVDVRPIQLTSFDEEGEEEGAESNLDLILDVPLHVTVELGRCRKTIQEILELNIGSIITLDRLAGEPVDVLVNNKQIARGEVIVIEENYGIRITEILTVQNRVRATRS